LVAFASCPVSASAQRQEDLWVKNYRNLNVLISLEDGVRKAGITEDTVRTKVELHLRQANIRPQTLRSISELSEDHQTLDVSVNVVGQAFGIEIGFLRNVVWTLPDGKIIRNFAATWNFGTTGTGNSSFILSSLDEVLDRFLNAYLKANQEGAQ
jgi:hypothetical protein